MVAALAAAGLFVMPVAARPAQTDDYWATGWYMLATLLLFVSVLVVLATTWAVLPPALVWSNYLEAAIVAKAALFSIVLGQRLPRMWLQHGQLHDRAAERTLATETDPLTRVANRGGRALSFKTSFRRAWAHGCIPWPCAAPARRSMRPPM